MEPSVDVVLTEDEVVLIRTAIESTLADLEGRLYVPDELYGLVSDLNDLLQRVTDWETIIEDVFYTD